MIGLTPSPRILVALLLAMLLAGIALPVIAVADEGPGGGDDEDERDGQDGQPDDDEEGEDDDSENRGRGGDHRNERAEQEEWEREERKVELAFDEKEFRAESSRESERAKDKLEFKFVSTNALLEVQFERENTSNEEESKIRVDHWRLFEFVDENGDGAFQSGEEVVQRFLPEHIQFRSFEQTSVDGGTRINATYRLNGTGTFTLSFIVPSTALNITGLQIDPTEIKFDIALTNFPFQRSDTLPAVALRVRAHAEFEDGEEEGMPALISEASGLQGFLRWVNTSTVDGAERPVEVRFSKVKLESSDDEFKTEADVVFVYARGASIVHDPSVGFGLATSSLSALLQPLGDWRLVAAGLGVATMVVAVTLWPRARLRE